jgi:hypothetical protein
MDAHRNVSPRSAQYIDLSQPFSCFDMVDSMFGGSPAIHRCFSLARSFSANTLVIEDIPATGIIEDENNEILDLYADYVCMDLKRLSFWQPAFDASKDIVRRTDNELIGYAILKKDVVPSRRDEWHIFEAVFKKYEHDHNCVPCPSSFKTHILDKEFSSKGILYCQQNVLNKACAHVALRSLLSRLVPDGDVSYRQLNDIAVNVSKGSYDPANGLNVECMQAILKAFGIDYTDLDYDKVSKTDPTIRTDVPYQKYLYAGIESGCGGLLGFSMSGPKAKNERHIIPFYGHTFNKDTWAPDANLSYFNIGGSVGYIPSEMWTSSFIGHDDNFGPNFCIPRQYVKPEQAQYVVELKKSGSQYGGIIAEAQALQFLYSLNPNLTFKNKWLERLQSYSHPEVQRVVLRAICVSRTDYLSHLKNMAGWEGNVENPSLISAFSKLLPELLWMVEVSIPHLFPANERKLGEIILNASLARDSKRPIDYKLFLMARFPAQYFLLKSVNQYGPQFMTIPSKIVSHTPLLKTEQ